MNKFYCRQCRTSYAHDDAYCHWRDMHSRAERFTLRGLTEWCVLLLVLAALWIRETFTGTDRGAGNG